jgi:dehydrogenase/reductase SDR family member 12
MTWARNLVDNVLERSVVGSLTRIGPAVRSRLDHWQTDTIPDLTGRTIVLSGATSGLGAYCATQLLQRGATLEVIARNASKAEQQLQTWRDGGLHRATVCIADTGDLGAVRKAAADIAQRNSSIDVVIHNAGALDDSFAITSDGIEQTIASHVIGPFLLTSLLLPTLAASKRTSRIIWVSSGGMYTEPLCVEKLEMSPTNYNGVTAYARAKRAQVTLSSMMSQRLDPARTVVHAMHPGWADTPGVARSLPRFRRIVGPLLRTPADGADTILWLATSDHAISSTGQFWLDRRPRSLYRSKASEVADSESERNSLWAWVMQRSHAPSW